MCLAWGLVSQDLLVHMRISLFETLAIYNNNFYQRNNIYVTGNEEKLKKFRLINSGLL